jgi:WD40 repeat protein
MTAGSTPHMLMLCRVTVSYSASGSPRSSMASASSSRRREGAFARIGTVRLRQDGLSCIAFSPKGQLLASAGLGASGGEIILWDPSTGRRLRSLIAHDAIEAIAFSHDGKVLASGGKDSNIILWQVATGKEISRLKGHRGPIMSVISCRQFDRARAPGNCAPGQGAAAK